MLNQIFGTQRPNEEQIRDKIKQRRWQMLIHSYIYYVRDTNIIDDETWQRWANELAVLQIAFPELCDIGLFDEVFKDWNGDSGFRLPLNDKRVVEKAEYLLSVWNNGIRDQ